MIRYRRSLNHKRCQLSDGRRRLVYSNREFKGNRKLLGSGGSMAARLKLKGIDGRAPPGVEPAA